MKPALMASLVAMFASGGPMRQAEAGGMFVSWDFLDDEIIFSVRYPGQGWAAIGFNTQDSLAQTNLVMMAPGKGAARISDRTILRPGEHVAVTVAGGRNHARLLAYAQEKNHSVVRLAIRTSPDDALHFSLHKGSRIYLLIAWSHEQDFAHHSAFRTTLAVHL
jgi:DOMON domain